MRASAFAHPQVPGSPKGFPARRRTRTAERKRPARERRADVVNSNIIMKPMQGAPADLAQIGRAALCHPESAPRGRDPRQRKRASCRLLLFGIGTTTALLVGIAPPLPFEDSRRPLPLAPKCRGALGTTLATAPAAFALIYPHVVNVDGMQPIKVMSDRIGARIGPRPVQLTSPGVRMLASARARRR